MIKKGGQLMAECDCGHLMQGEAYQIFKGPFLNFVGVVRCHNCEAAEPLSGSINILSLEGQSFLNQLEVAENGSRN